MPKISFALDSEVPLNYNKDSGVNHIKLDIRDASLPIPSLIT